MLSYCFTQLWQRVSASPVREMGLVYYSKGIVPDVSIVEKEIIATNYDYPTILLADLLVWFHCHFKYYTLFCLAIGCVKFHISQCCFVLYILLCPYP